MKVAITRTDGTKIELEGSAEELNKVLFLLIPLPYAYATGVLGPWDGKPLTPYNPSDGGTGGVNDKITWTTILKAE